MPSFVPKGPIVPDALLQDLVLQPGLFEKANDVKDLHEQTEPRRFR
jgi:hypothetical protein